MAGCAAGWVAVAVSARMFFPLSLSGLWIVGLFPALVAAGFLVLGTGVIGYALSRMEGGQ